MKNQLEIDELSNVLDHEREDQIKKLSKSLKDAEDKVTRNNAAADILNDLIEKGVVHQDDSGEVIVR